MSFLKRSVPILTAAAIGVATGYYVFEPLLRQYEKDTKGTWKKPGDDERIEEIKKEFPIVKKLEGESTNEKTA
ncbi:hypothetical protein K450DRAFT_276584 [Umbelopsis ramanniana AG]|uniref:Uncharacterized protein n=1 Tax=Umbelopsis ramanniana AG TaxID=1314678 RepID=A0AAD5EKU1_UMBRA|nr:uncharacterized protein K450DRAFT_276584 [Umbelopsis ramanniana AG]KAI8584215.1 hypothetical protein K450DRAFT_276584 [Umbelopsis ramanniana AG]